MMKIKLHLALVAVSLIMVSCGKEKFAIAGSGWQEIAIVDKASGLIEWKHALEADDECNDIEVTPDGNVLFAYKNGAKLINRKHETVWDYKAKENEEIHTATRLKNGGFMLAICANPSAKIVELDKKGVQTKELTFPSLTFTVHDQFRQVLKTDSLYLIPLLSKSKILRLSEDGKIRGTVFVGHEPYSVKQLSNGHLLVSCGNDHLFTDIDPELKQVDNFTLTKEIKGASLLYVAEIIPFEKTGHKIIANSNMYSDDKSQPLLIEIDENNEVVWSLPFNRQIKNITAVYSFKE